MPIIDSVAATEPLSQGDILRGVRLYAATAAGEPMPLQQEICLVISRPCVAIRKSFVAVVPVEQWKNPSIPKEAMETFEDMQAFFKDLRDGTSRPDIFYIGNLPTEGQRRFTARFDSIHTIQIPDTDPQRQEFVAAKRVGRLHIAFSRDLHCRLFQTFASLGFEDHSWFSNEDLDLLVKKGQEEVLKAKLAAVSAGVNTGVQGLSGRHIPDKHRLEAEAAHATIAAMVKPFEDELAARSRRTPPP